MRVLLVLLLLTSSAWAGEPRRHLRTTAGEDLVGCVVQRGPQHWQLALDDGTLRELPLPTIASIEVEWGTGDLPCADPVDFARAPGPVSPRRTVASARARSGHALALGLGLPLAGTGAGMAMTGLLTGFPALEAVSGGLSGLGLAAGVGGADVAILAAGGAGTATARLFRAGILVGLLGNLLVDTTLLVHEADAAPTLDGHGALALVATGVGAEVVAACLLGIAARSARYDLADREQAARVPLPWIAPTDGGIQGGLALAW